MCGIAGFVNYRRNYLSDRGKYEHILMKMCQVLYHRGPDESGRVLRENYGLAHTRLSIIDLKNWKRIGKEDPKGVQYHIIAGRKAFIIWRMQKGKLCPKKICEVKWNEINL